jgi:Ca-activated chloride channel family protein
LDLAQRSALWLLLLIPCLLAWVRRGRRIRAEQWSLLGQGGRLRGDGSLGWIAAIACLIFALAQPRWGRIPAPPLPPGRDVVLLVDASRSMAARDAVPDRLGVAVEAGLSLVRALAQEPGNRVAVAAFAGRGVLRCPLTENTGAALDSLAALRPGTVRPEGTDLGAGLAAALEAFGSPEREPEQAGGRTVVLFSDGEDHVGAWERAVEKLRAAGIVVHAVAVGDGENGHPIPGAPGEGALTYRGTPVLSQRDDRGLAAIAEATGGAFVPLGLAAADLGALYLKRIEPVARLTRLVFRPSERAEQYGWFVLAALLLGLLASWPWRGGREVRPRRLVGPAALVILLALGAGAARETDRVQEGRDAAMLVEAGRAAYAAGRWTEALAAFEQASALEPGAPVPHYDVAATLFQMKRFTEARNAYTEARSRAGDALRMKIDFALGNTALALGDVAEAIAHYDACLASRSAGPDVEAVRRDAAVNRRFALESARHRPLPPDSNDASSSAPKSARRPSEERDEEGSQRTSSGAGTSQDVTSPGSSRPGRRGPGGAGGSGPAPDGAGSPEDQLEAAVARIRESRGHRLPEPPPPAPTGDGRKEW